MKIYYLLFLIVFSTLLIFPDLGSYRMLPIDDCYYAQKAKEIIVTGDWLTLHYAGKTSVDNAPLYMWLIAVMFKCFGINEYSARMVSAFFSLATILSVYFLGRMLFDKWVGLFSSFVMLSTPMFFMFSRRTMVDVTLTFWISLAMIFFLKGLKEKKYFLLFGLSTGIIILTKSAFGFFPIVIAALYLLILKDFKKFTDPFFLLGIVIAFAVSLPWYCYQYISYPEQFAHDHLSWLLYEGAFLRNKTGTPAWYLKSLLVYYWPWLPFAAWAFVKLMARNIRKAEPASLILLSWVIVIIGVMSFMSSKKYHYIMSAYPPLAILTSVSLCHIMDKEKTKKIFIKTCFVFLALLSVASLTTPFKLPQALEKDKYYAVDETWSIAMFAKENIPENEKTVLYNIWFWRIRSLYLFYSDRDISRSVFDKNRLLKIFKEGKAKYCLTSRDGFSELSEIKELKTTVLKETPTFVFFAASINPMFYDQR